MDVLFVILKLKENCSMKQFLFVDWLENHFKLSAEQYQTNKISVKVILLVDDIKAHEIQWA